MTEIDKLKKEIEDLKKNQMNADERRMLDVLRTVSVRNPEELSDLISRDDDETPPTGKYRDDDYDDDDDDEIESYKQKVDRLEAQIQRDNFQRQLFTARERLSREVLRHKDKYKFLASQAGNSAALDNILQIASDVYQKTGREVNQEELFKAQDDAFKKNFIHQAQVLNMTPEELDQRLNQETKKAEDNNKEKDQTQDQQKPKENFQQKTEKQLGELNSEDLFQHYFDEAEAKQKNLKMVDPKEDEPPKENDSDKQTEPEPKRVSLKSGGIPSQTAGQEETADQERNRELKEAGFDV